MHERKNLHKPCRYSYEHHDDEVLIIVVDAGVVALQLQHTGVEVDGLYSFKDNGKIIWPCDSNSGSKSERRLRNAVAHAHSKYLLRMVKT